MFGLGKREIIGKPIESLLEAFPALTALIRASNTDSRDEYFEKHQARWYEVTISLLLNPRGFKLGRFVWIQDITDRKERQAQITEQARFLGMLKERELLARELHDNIGQILAAVNLQATAANELLAKGETVMAQGCLKKSIDLTQQVKDTIRSYLSGVIIGSSPEPNFWTEINQRLLHYHNYGIQTVLSIAPELASERLGSSVVRQLRPIIHEALANAQRHSRCETLRVRFTLCEDMVRITIEDDGRGFDLNAPGNYLGFGLRSMRGRAEEVGGCTEGDSKPGKGTRVIVHVPFRKETV
jgi:signal transduction histidine kinase